MLKVVSGSKEYNIELEEQYEQGIINGQLFQWNVSDISEGRFSIIRDNKSYEAEVAEIDLNAKTMRIKVNNTEHLLQIKDRFDELLEKMGMNGAGAGQVKEIKAPMPGLVLEIQIKVGDEVAEGDALLVLEAMKMENVIKSPTSGKVKSIEAKKSKAVEKNEVLIKFE